MAPTSATSSGSCAFSRKACLLWLTYWEKRFRVWASTLSSATPRPSWNFPWKAVRTGPHSMRLTLATREQQSSEWAEGQGEQGPGLTPSLTPSPLLPCHTGKEGGKGSALGQVASDRALEKWFAAPEGLPHPSEAVRAGLRSEFQLGWVTCCVTLRQSVHPSGPELPNNNRHLTSWSYTCVGPE